MSDLDPISRALTEMRASKRRLDEASQAFSEAVSRYHKLIEQQALERDIVVSSQGSRLPKGKIESLLELCFSTGRLSRSRFEGIAQEVDLLAGQEVSRATIRQTLYRMETKGKLERYSGEWSKGHALRR